MSNRCAWMIGVAFGATSLVLAHCSGGGNSTNGTLDGGHGDGYGGGSGSSGGSSSGVLSDDSGGNVGFDSGGSSSGGGDSGSNPGDGGVVDTGPPPTPVPEGGLPSDPGVVQCAGAACSTATSFCCKPGGEGGAESCDTYNGSTCAGNSVQIGCNEAADCAGGDVCCQTAFGLGLPGTAKCAKTCAGAFGTGTSFQICRTNSECPVDAGAAQMCIPQTCTATGQGGATATLEACAQPPGFGRDAGGALLGCAAK